MSSVDPAAASGGAPAPAAPRRPAHVAIVMDGNGRWAQARRQPRSFGHRAGVKAVKTAVETCLRESIPVLTLFAFSSENWRRPASEVSALMNLFLRALDREVDGLHENGVRVRFVGDASRFAEELATRMREVERRTAGNTRLSLNVAANYGGRWDLAQAARALAQDVAAGRIDPATIDEDALGARLSLADLPEPDLFIRTGGERRISNFLLWQLAYAELWFTDVLWPDFDGDCLRTALADFAGRERRFGRTSAQVEGAA
jgi:undecaprenyl diphosphate synthase